MDSIAAWVILHFVASLAWGGQHKTAQTFVFQTTDAMAAVWMADGGDVNSLPLVNFDKETVVAVFAGQKATGGYQIRIESIRQVRSVRTTPTTADEPPIQPGTNVVLFRETGPEPGSVVTRALSYPSHVVAIEKTDGPFMFVNADSDEAAQLDGLDRQVFEAGKRIEGVVPFQVRHP